MSVAGLKKQFNKVNQYMSEKIGGAKGTELDDEFMEMERQIDVMGKLVDELMARTHELLQPNPASRAKLSAVKSISKLRGQQNHGLYPQPEGMLGECMIRHGKDLGEENIFGQALMESGEAYKQLSDVKYSLEDNVKQNFIEPLHHIQTKDLKEVNHHRKKLQGRRLDYDCKKRKQVKGANVTEEEIVQAEDKFEESKTLAETAMWNLLENDVEQISALASFVDAEVNFHRQSADVLQNLHESLQEKISEASSKTKKNHIPKRVASSTRLDTSPGYEQKNNYNSYGGSQNLNTPSNFGSYGSSRDEPLQNSGVANSTQHQPSHQDPFDPFTLGSFSVSSFEKPESSGKPSYNGAANEPDATYSSIDYSKKTSRKSKMGGGSSPCAKALYDFEPENEGELGFKEGDMITLIERIDDNWFEGSNNGVSGFFPVNYVEVVVDL